MESVEDRLTRLEVGANTTENELDRISNSLEKFRGETRFRWDRIDDEHAAIRRTLRTMDTKIDVVTTVIAEHTTRFNGIEKALADILAKLT